jgi:hypothetical protein
MTALPRLFSRLLLTLTTGVALLAAVAAPASASGPRADAGVTVSGAGSAVVQPFDTVVCSVTGSAPTLSGGVLTATGRMSGCTPHNPYTCRTETDLQIYVKNIGWSTVQHGSVSYNCPGVGSTTSFAIYSCHGTASNLYRTETIIAVVYGTSGTAVYDSNGVFRSCS